MSSPLPNPALRVLAVEPWLGGSHRAFLENWKARSRHEVEICGLAARLWKWRMRSGAWELARELAGHEVPDVLLLSDYLDLPAFLGFLPGEWSRVPSLLYFHENQLTYPVQEQGKEFDTTYGFTNLLSCLRASQVVFNSAFHRRAFTDAGLELLRRLPKPGPHEEFVAAMEGATVIAPGIPIEEIRLGPGNPGGPLRILFPHRWEYDKNPLAFLQAMLSLRQHTTDFELVLLGEQYSKLPPGVEDALTELQPQIAHHGFLALSEAYYQMLGSCDVVVSTAQHEFFGLAITEAMAAGALPLVPDRLSYPEVLGETLAKGSLHDSTDSLGAQLRRLVSAPEQLRGAEHRRVLRERAANWSCDLTAGKLDQLAETLAANPQVVGRG